MYAVCQKCGKVTENSEKWLIAPRKDNPERLVVRCPEHISSHALQLAGINQNLTKPQPNHVTISRHFILGWGYTTPNTDPPTPIHTGTYLKVMDAIMHDQHFQDVLKNNLPYNSNWFVRINGIWRKVIVGYPTNLARHTHTEVDLEPQEK